MVTPMPRPAPEPQLAAAMESTEFTRNAALPFELAVYDCPFTVQLKLSVWPLGDVGVPPHAAVMTAVNRIARLTSPPTLHAWTSPCGYRPMRIRMPAISANTAETTEGIGNVASPPTPTRISQIASTSIPRLRVVRIAMLPPPIPCSVCCRAEYSARHGQKKLPGRHGGGSLCAEL